MKKLTVLNIIRELISCNLRSRIDRSAILTHHIDIYRMNEIDAMQERS